MLPENKNSRKIFYIENIFNPKKDESSDLHQKDIEKILNKEVNEYNEIYKKYWHNYLLKNGSKEEEISNNDNVDYTTIEYPIKSKDTKEIVNGINKLVKFKDKTDNLGGERMVLDMINTIKSGKNVGLIFSHITAKDIPLFACYFLKVAKKNGEEIEDIAKYFQIIIGPAVIFHKGGSKIMNALGNIMKTRPNRNDFIEKILEDENFTEEEKEIIKNIASTISKKFKNSFGELINSNNTNNKGNIFFLAPTGANAATDYKEKVLFNGEQDPKTLVSLGLFERLGDNAKIYNIGINNLKLSREEMIGPKVKAVDKINKVTDKVKKTSVIIKLENITEEFNEFKKIVKEDNIARIRAAKLIFDSLASCIVDEEGNVIGENVTKDEVLKMKKEMERKI